MEIKSHTEYLCRYLKSGNDKWVKVKIGNQTRDRMCVTFLEPYRCWWIGEFKWWFTEEFLNVYELKPIEICQSKQ